MPAMRRYREQNSSSPEIVGWNAGSLIGVSSLVAVSGNFIIRPWLKTAEAVKYIFRNTLLTHDLSRGLLICRNNKNRFNGFYCSQNNNHKLRQPSPLANPRISQSASHAGRRTRSLAGWRINGLTRVGINFRGNSREQNPKERIMHTDEG